MKLKKDGSVMWREVHELAALLHSGQYTWWVDWSGAILIYRVYRRRTLTDI